MTNGEKIKEIFPNIDNRLDAKTGIMIVKWADNTTKFFKTSWWDLEYKAPTTKNNLAHNLCDSCTNIGCELQSGIVRTKCAFYMPPQLEPDNCGNYVVQDSTIKNDIRDNRVKNELNRVKDELEPTTKNDLAVDSISFKGMMDHLKITAEDIENAEDLEYSIEPLIHPKNDLGVDAVSRKDVHDMLENLPVTVENKLFNWLQKACMRLAELRLAELPSVTPQEHKVGRWIFAEGTKGKDNVEKCSCCGSHWKEAIIYQTDTQEYLRTRLLYCPSCGSRNEVEE